MSDNPISEIAYNDIPQAVKDWMYEIGWEREDIRSYHAKYSAQDNLIEVTIKGAFYRHFALFTKLDNGSWQKVLE